MLAIGMAAVFSVVMLTIGPVLYRWMGGRGEILDAALAYSSVAFGGAVSVCMLNILANVVRGTGNMSFPAGVLVGSVLLHVVISPALIFGWGPLPALGVAGAGLGLVISFGAGSAVLIAYLTRPDSPVKLAFRGVRYQRELFGEFFKVGIPGLVNVAINNLAVVVLTGVAGHLGREAAIGYAMGARLEYIMIPLAFGCGTAMVAMVGTNWGAKQFQRARRIAWTGAASVALTCAAMGVFFAIFPGLWMGLYSTDEEVIRAGTLYLTTMGPVYGVYGLGMALYFAMQGVGNVVPAVAANGLRMIMSAGGALAAIHWFDAGLPGVFVAIAAAFVAYGVLTAVGFARNSNPRGKALVC
jgi:Na+-driven multidrug efflux pump